MSKIVVGPMNRGLRTDVTPFVIDNDSFPNLINAYQWRGRVKRKRGTELLGRLTRFFNSLSKQFNPGTTTQVLSAGGAGNLLTGFASSGIQSTASIVPGSVTINDETTSTQYTDDSNGNLVPGGTINYATGAFTISPAAADTVDANFNYYPNLPVMGLRQFLSASSEFPFELAFDTTYAYNINTTSPYALFSVSFYKNPPTSGSYTQKSAWSPVNWNGQNYQQFWSTNYSGALWATNGITVPFTTTNIGMQFKPITVVTVPTPGGNTASLAIASHGLVVGDFIFVNEVITTKGINFQTGYVTTVTDSNNVIVTFPNATITSTGRNGIAQYLTSNAANPTLDCIRWYDGAPNSGATPPVFTTGSGWVNFCPPLSLGNSYSIADELAAQYYLVGARVIVPFKDRLLFFGPVIQTSSSGSQIYLPDTVIYSENGTPFYTCSFPYDENVPTVQDLFSATFTPLLVPTDEVAFPGAFFEDLNGLGGFLRAGYSQAITTVSTNEDVLIVGFTSRQARLVYTGNDLVPFDFYVINSELGSSGTFSAITLDRGVLSVGPNGIIITSQVSAERIDLEIPDQVFQFALNSNGTQRICSQRDFINEWIYFTYSWSGSNSTNIFPGQTLQYNYRDNSWAVFNECYTTYGTFRKVTGEVWDDLTYFTWDEWNDPWDSGESTLDQPLVIGGNQQGFVMVRAQGTGEDPSGYISAISSASVVTSTNHGLNEGDYIIITGCLGTIGTYVNGQIFSVASPSPNMFSLNPTVPSGTYLGNGVFTRMYVPFIQTKQFPVSWDMSRKTRLGVQQYLFTATAQSQVTLLIFLSQNGSSPYNIGPIVPENNSINNSLVYSTVLYTCPESTNIGLTPAEINLQMITAQQQAQIWHRMNTSLLGDTIQVGFTLSDSQMRSLIPVYLPSAITAITQANPCVITCDNNFGVGGLVSLSEIVGMTQLNGNIYIITAASATQISIEVDSTSFTAYLSGGLATPVAPIYQFDEIELHSIILDVTPSQVLA